MRGYFSKVWRPFLFLVVFVSFEGSLAAANPPKFFPLKNVAVQNGRFGAGLNMDFQFATPSPDRAAEYKYFMERRNGTGVFTSVRGFPNDENAGFELGVRQNSSNAYQYFPPHRNIATTLRDFEIAVNLTSFSLRGRFGNLRITQTWTSPFFPMKENPSELVKKMNFAPFFYVELKIENIGNSDEPFDVSIGMKGVIEEARLIAGLKTQLYRVRSDKSGLRGFSALPDRFPLLRMLQRKPELNPFMSVDLNDFSQSSGGFTFTGELEPGRSAHARFIYSGFLNEAFIQDNRMPAKQMRWYKYKAYFGKIDHVIEFAKGHRSEIEKYTDQFESLLDQSPYSDVQKFAVAQSFHSYLTNTIFLSEASDRDASFLVKEGACGFMSTVDVAHETSIIEGLFFPSAIKYQIQDWISTKRSDAYGEVIQHDIGSGGYEMLTPKQAYDTDIGGNMSVEENLNLVLLARWYQHQSKDDQFIRANEGTLHALIESVIRRDTNADGLPDMLAYFNTYDLGNALHVSAQNLYIGIKLLGALISIQKMFPHSPHMEMWNQTIGKLNLTIQTASMRMGNADHRLPTVLFDNWTSFLAGWNYYDQYLGRKRIAAEANDWTPVHGDGLLYPVLTGDLFSPDVFPYVKTSLETIYHSNLRNFEGTRVKSTEGFFTLAAPANTKPGDLQTGETWLSKVFISSYVTQQLGQRLELAQTPLLGGHFDPMSPLSFAGEQHLKNGYAGFACDWKNVGDHYEPGQYLLWYPRGVSSFLFNPAFLHHN